MRPSPEASAKGAYTMVRDRDERRRGRKMPPYTAFPSINQQSLPSKRGDTSKTRRTRLSDGEYTKKYMTRGKRKSDNVLQSISAFPLIKRINRLTIPPLHFPPLHKGGLFYGIPSIRTRGTGLRSIYAFRPTQTKQLPLKRGDTSYARSPRILRSEFT